MITEICQRVLDVLGMRVDWALCIGVPVFKSVKEIGVSLTAVTIEP